MDLLCNRIRDNGGDRLLLLHHLKTNTEAGVFYQKLGLQYVDADPDADNRAISLHVSQ